MKLQEEMQRSVSKYLSENINSLIPDLPKIRNSMKDVRESLRSTSNGGNKAFALAKETLKALEELKSEFEYMQTRFSPHFMQRIDKSMSQLNSISHELDEVRATANQAAPKKDLELVNQKLQNYVQKKHFLDLQNQCLDYAK